MNHNHVVLAEQWIVSLYAAPDHEAVDVRYRAHQVTETLDVVAAVLNGEWEDVRIEVTQ